MKASPKMQKVVEAIGQKFGVDFSKIEAHIRLDMPHYDRLCIENIGHRRISVAHYFESNGDLVADPDIVFFVDDQLGWLPVEISQSLTGWASYVQMSDDGMTILRYAKAQQADLASFAQTWAQNIIDQGWLERATRNQRISGCQSTNHTVCYGELWTCESCGKSFCFAEGTDNHPELCDNCWVKRQNDIAPTVDTQAWPEPTTEQPDLDTIADWIVDSVCEATDGCMVEPDGICEHGHPSWLLRFGLM